LVASLFLVNRRLIFAVRRGVVLGGIFIRVPVLSLPVGAHEPASFLEVGCLVKVLLAALDFRLHSAPGLAPFTQVGSGFFVTALVG